LNEKLPKVWEISDNFVICFNMPENVLKPGNMVCYWLLWGLELVSFSIPSLRTGGTKEK